MCGRSPCSSIVLIKFEFVHVGGLKFLGTLVRDFRYMKDVVDNYMLA